MENRITEIESKLATIYPKIEGLRAEISEVELDPNLTQKEKDREIAILRFHLQENSNIKNDFENQLRNLNYIVEHRKNNPMEVEVYQAEDIIPKQYMRQIAELKKMQNMLESRIAEEESRNRRTNTSNLTRDEINYRRNHLHGKIRTELAFLCNSTERKMELEKIFGIRF